MFSKYRELGLPLIPLKPKTKRPIMDEWSRYCVALPSESETELWDRLWESGHQNVGLCLGSAGGIVGVDLDTHHQNLMDIAPPSPVRKKGQTGETRFFRWSESIPLIHDCAIDILSTGSQTVLPPSIHPDTGKPYEWLTPDTLENFSVSDLPELELSWLPSYIALAEKLHPEKKKGGGGIGGRNNWLTDVVWAKRMANETEAEIVEAVYGMDISKNSPRLFTDPKEGFKAMDETEARLNAWRFVASVTASFIKRKAGPAPSVQSLEVALTLGEAKKKRDVIPMPEAKGTLGRLYKLCYDMGHRDQPWISMGGVIAISSVIMGNRYRMGRTWPNVFVLNVAPTGSGKSFPQSLAKRLLAKELGKEDLLGYGNYRSSVAIVKGLDKKRERLDVIDEASSLFMTIAEGGSFQRDMDDVLCDLFSVSNDLYIGPEAAGKEGLRVWNPCLSVLFSTTPQGLKDSISRAIATKGFFPRCLPFIDHDYGAQKKPVIDEAMITEVGRIFRDIRRMTIGKDEARSDLINDVPDPIDIPVSRAAESMLEKTNYDWNEEISKSSRSELERVLLTRAGEQSKKLAIIHGALNSGRVEAEDASWACQMVDAVRRNAMLLLPQVAAENRNQANLERVYALINDKGALSHKELIYKTRFLSKRERNDILDSLVEEGVIQRQQDEKGTIWVSLTP